MKFSALRDKFRHQRDFVLLAAAMLLLLTALLRPTVPIERDIYSFLFVVDITQSMNTEDMQIDGKPGSRIAYTRRLLQEMSANMPCGTKVGIAFFAGANVALQYSPIEVCSNFDAIYDHLARMEWRMAWSGNSRLRQGVHAIAHLTRTLQEPVQVVFFTDGEEAPHLHTFNTLDLKGFQGAQDWLVVGIGSDKGTPIPKYDENNKLLGYWSIENFAVQPGIAQISQETFGSRNSDVAQSDSSRYYSRLDENYLKRLTEEIGSNYVRGDSFSRVQSAVYAGKPARRDTALLGINRFLAAFAGLLLLTSFMPWQHLRAMLERSKHARLLGYQR